MFYQLLAGASPDERDSLDLQDPSSYALLAQSGCYRLPGGLFSDDAAQMGELRAAMASLGFKAKHVKSIFSLLTAILLLSNITFIDSASPDTSAQVEDMQLLDQVARMLGVSVTELEIVLVNRTRWIKNDLCSMILDAAGASAQRDSLMRDLYAILFTFVVEMANRKLAPSADVAPELQIVQLDIPGWQSRTPDARPSSSFGAPLVNAAGDNGFDEFSTNFVNELLHSYILRKAFQDDTGLVADGLSQPQVAVNDNAACVELLRGGLLGSSRLSAAPGGVAGLLSTATQDLKGEQRTYITADSLVSQLRSSFGRSSSLTTSSRNFTVNHYAAACTYDVSDFAEKNNDILDKQLVDLLRSSADPFIAKLASGPGLATEGHPLDPNITVEAQVISTPLRTPSTISGSQSGWPIDSSIPQPVMTQVNAILSIVLAQLDHARLWTVACIRPNDSGHPNSFDKRRVKAQVTSLALPELIRRDQTDFIADMALVDFCERHALDLGSPLQSVSRFAESLGWIPEQDYQIGRARIWLSWGAWKEQEDLIRMNEESARGVSAEETLADSDENVGNRPFLAVAPQYGQPLDSSMDDLLLRHRGPDGSIYSPNTPGDGFGGTPEYPVNSRKASFTDDPIGLDGEGDGEMIVHEKRHHATEVIATSPARRWWLRITWALTWWIPSFLLVRLGGMKRADVRMAWREKVAIFMMIMFMCGTVLFYIVVFGMLLCPDSAKAWNPTELAEHAGTDDYYAAIAGKVYDVSASVSLQVPELKFSLSSQSFTRASIPISRRTLLRATSCSSLQVKI